MVNFINTAPIYEPWKSSVHRPGWYVEEAPPAILNKHLAAGRLDLGFVSSYEYGVRPQQYRILPGLSISANGRVGSVFLFSHKPLEQLDAAQVVLSSQSETSVALTKVILEEFVGVRPHYLSGDIARCQPSSDQAVLAIGDEALRLVEDGKFVYQYDLGEIWKLRTGLPFVFAVCAVREEFCRNSPELLAQVYHELLRCRTEGAKDLHGICTIAAPRIPMDVRQCYDYLKGIEYDLGPEKQQALQTFFTYLIARGEAHNDALPLKIHVLQG